MRRSFRFTVGISLTLLGLETATASLDTIGPNGINSAGLTLFDGTTPLSGDGIGVGQVEPGRPAVHGFDSPGNSNAAVVPTAVTLQDGDPLVMNANLEAGHPLHVAGIIISTGGENGSELFGATNEHQK